MLSLEQIMKLQDKGFTYEQMQILNNMNLTAAPAAPAEPKPEPEQPAEPNPEPVQPAEPKPEQDATGELKKQIDELTATVKAMQAQNVKQAEQDAPKKLTAEDVIKSFMVAS